MALALVSKSELAEFALAVSEWSATASDITHLLETQPGTAAWTEEALARELRTDPLAISDALEELFLAGAIAPASDEPGWRRA